MVSNDCAVQKSVASRSSHSAPAWLDFGLHGGFPRGCEERRSEELIYHVCFRQHVYHITQFKKALLPTRIYFPLSLSAYFSLHHSVDSLFIHPFYVLNNRLPLLIYGPVPDMMKLIGLKCLSEVFNHRKHFKN